MESYQIQVKARCRKHLRKFIQKHLKAVNKKPHSITVLCFPGIEGLEILEVYDKLGIPRKNITCIEREVDVYEALKTGKATAGCNIIHTAFSKFVREDVVKQFDIISLDFMGHLASFEEDIYEMVRRGLTKEKTVIFTNFSGARESEKTQGLYYARSAYANVATHNFMDVVKDHDALLEDGEDFLKFYEESELKDVRDDGIFFGLLKVICICKKNKLLDIAVDFFKAKEMAQSLLDQFKPEIDKMPVNLQKVIKFNEGIIKGSGLTRASIDFLERSFEGWIEERLLKSFSLDVFEEEVVISDDEGEATISLPMRGLCEFILRASYAAFAATPIMSASSSYRYVSSNGMPMFADVFLIEEVDKHFSFMSEYLDKEANDLDGVFSKMFSLSPRDFTRLLPKIGAAVKAATLKQKDARGINRMFLGSESAVTPKNKDKEEFHKKVEPFKDDNSAKKRVVGLLDSDSRITTEQLAFLTGAPFRKVAAWRAHHTMGTYKN